MQKNPNKTFTELEEKVMFNKATERAFTGEYDDFYKEGDYVCRNCDTKLYSSKAKFDAGCGWPAFDDIYEGAVKQIPDSDGRRVEIVCSNCGIHLGHVFVGEQITEKNTRHCVNSVSIKFIPAENNIKEIVVGCGCFWGVEHWFAKLNGVIETTVGYSGGHFENPSYKDVLSHTTGHKEVLKIKYDQKIVTLEKVLKYFFEIHDFSQTNGQGNDIGDQYTSVIFYNNNEEKLLAENIIDTLKEMNYKVATEVLPTKTFYEAEEYHQDYYAKNGDTPYCHFYQPIFK